MPVTAQGTEPAMELEPLSEAPAASGTGVSLDALVAELGDELRTALLSKHASHNVQLDESAKEAARAVTWSAISQLRQLISETASGNVEYDAKGPEGALLVAPSRRASQRPPADVSILRGARVLVADDETVQMHAAGNRYGSVGRLIVEAQGELGSVDLDVLERANAAVYWERDSRHDTVISLTYGRPALDALCRDIEAWIEHFLQLRTRVKPIRRIDEPRWAWHVGLDAESTAILNELWAGGEVDAGRMRRVLALFALQFDDPAAMRQDIAGRTVYLALACGEDEVVRMKPQNLLINLPLNEA